MGQAKNRGTREDRVALAQAQAEIQASLNAKAAAEATRKAQAAREALVEYRGTAEMVHGRLKTRGVSGMLALALAAGMGVHPKLVSIGPLNDKEKV